LSHDSLVQPILATSRVRGITEGVVGLLSSGLLSLLSLAVMLAGALALRDGLATGTVVFGVAFLGLTLWLAIFGARRSVETLNRYLGRRRTVWVWLICACTTLPFGELAGQVISFVSGNDTLTPGGIVAVLLLSIKTVTFGWGALALFGFRPMAVPLFAVSLVITIATILQRLAFDVSPSAIRVLVSAAVLVLEVATLTYAWRLRKRGVLH
jgi:hypothetical protein